MTCNHEELTSRFCPDCGTKIREGNDLYGLLRHCEVNATKQEKLMVEEYGDKSLPKKSIYADTAKKWRTWETKLRELLEMKRNWVTEEFPPFIPPVAPEPASQPQTPSVGKDFGTTDVAENAGPQTIR